MSRLLVATLSVLLLLPSSGIGLSAPSVSGAERTSTTTEPIGCPPQVQPSFPDVPATNVHREEIACLEHLGIVTGDDTGAFRPAAWVTRGQAASMVVRTVLAAGRSLPPPLPQTTHPTGSTHDRAARRLLAAGLLDGFPDGSLGLDRPITRGQAATLLFGSWALLGLQLSDAPAADFPDTTGTAHAEAIAELSALAVFNGNNDGTFRPGDPILRAQLASAVARFVQAAAPQGLSMTTAADAVDTARLTATACLRRPYDRSRADGLLEGRLLLDPHPETSLPARPRWDEDPFQDRNWRFQYHALRWLWSLVNSAESGDDPRYLDRALELAESWVVANPFDDPADPFAWNDHAAAWRALVLGCLDTASTEPAATWLSDAMLEHRRRLRDPEFYVEVGNHALNQDLGLLVLACLTGGWDDRDLAAERIAALATGSIDRDGVTNEQAAEYQAYNYERYLVAAELLDACGLPPADWDDRLARMPVVLAHLTQPDGTLVQLGDTDRKPVKSRFTHPSLRWFLTDGDDGSPPEETFVSYAAGFTLARTGWGTPGELDAEGFLSLRHGSAPAFHGHDDHGSITLFGDGQPLVVDPGKYAYEQGPERDHARHRAAHNTVTVGASCAGQAHGASPVLEQRSEPGIDVVVVEVATCPDTSWVRTLAFLRATGEVVVVDEVIGPPDADVTQHWQLEADAEVVVATTELVVAAWPGGARLRIDQLRPGGTVDDAAGQLTPRRGWISPQYGELVAAPNVAFTRPTTGRDLLVTVLRPGHDAGARRPSLTVTDTEVAVTVPGPTAPVDVVLARHRVTTSTS